MKKAIFIIPAFCLLFLFGCTLENNRPEEKFGNDDNWTVYQILQKPGYADAKTVVKRKGNRITNLTIENAKISTIPPQLSNLDSLKSLVLSGNEIKNIEAISDLGCLVNLQLSDNKIHYLPDISNLNSLKILSLNNNLLEGSVDCRVFPKSLEKLSINDNEITDFENIGQLTSLEYLSITRNKLKKIPENICMVKRLSDLGLYANPIQTQVIDLSCLESLTFLTIDSALLGKIIAPDRTSISF